MSLPVDAFTGILHPDIHRYLETLAPERSALLQRLEAYAKERGFPLVGYHSGQVMGLLAQLSGARRVFEFGSGFGYSAYFFAKAVGESGEVHGAEKDAWELDAHERLYKGESLKQRIHLHHGGAFDVFEGLAGSFDVVFFDLDKVDYPRALEVALPRLSPGGILLADNVLWGGKTARPAADEDVGTRSLQAYNRLSHEHPELTTAILPVGDGLAVSRKKR